LATLPTERRLLADQSAADSQHTDHLKQVPQERCVREKVRSLADDLAAGLDKSRPLAKHQIEAHSRAILDEVELPEGFLGWTMVAVASAFWRDQVERVPYERRLLLLPHCLRDADNCPAEYNQLGLLCQDCGACGLTSLRRAAAERGYRVLIAEGSPVVMQLILAGQADAVLGVGCLNSLEKALDKILLVGLPSMAVPLHASTCKNTSTDEDWIREMIDTPYQSGLAVTQTHVHLLRCAANIFEESELDRLVPPGRGGPSLAEADGRGLDALDPLAVTEAIARDFLVQGGKHFRPFITLASYDALTGGRASGEEGAEHVARIPDAVKRVAMAMEVFHKASLVHDDIEDDDGFRYGQPTVHRRFGQPVAINVGDYLVGLGYRLVAGQQGTLSAESVADILGKLSEAHTRLCEGQGAELAWRQANDKRLTPLDALKIYALKTSPAFEVALFAGLRMAGPAGDYREPAARFARHLGVAFQILNDLEDWDRQPANKRGPGGDVFGGRPTVLWAMALESLRAKDRRQLVSLVGRRDTGDRQAVLAEVRRLYERGDVFRRASDLVVKHRRRARQVADAVEPDQLSRLLHYFVDTIVPTAKSWAAGRTS
jgi:geranylgeranyl pyrophosphate synthase